MIRSGLNKGGQRNLDTRTQVRLQVFRNFVVLGNCLNPDFFIYKKGIIFVCQFHRVVESINEVMIRKVKWGH